MTTLAEYMRAHHLRLQAVELGELLATPGRSDDWCFEAAGLTLDLSRQRLDQPALQALLALAAERSLGEGIGELLTGAVVNPTEQRPALHTALRAESGPMHAQVEAVRGDMRRFAEDLQAGRLVGYDGRAIRHLVHIGIGGSELGPRLVWEALKPQQHEPAHQLHFVASLDQHQQQALRRRLDPAETLIVVVSKSFSTEETLENGTRWRDWLAAGAKGADIEPQLWAATANVDKARAWGVARERQMPMWDWVGGRYSLWSGVSLAVVGALGWPCFERLLQGAAAMDQHFATAPLAENLPVLKALCDLWNANVRGLSGRAVVSYDPRLAALPNYLQQLEMESNGKGVDLDGHALSEVSAGIVWGGTGTEVQHAFFQALHQGTAELPLDLIGVAQPDHEDLDAHRRQWAHLLAQASALAHGCAHESPHRRCPGNRSSQLIILPRLDAEHLGALLALHEHATFVRGWLWRVNPFDQFGVELGKQIASDTYRALNGEEVESLDAPTRQRAAQLASLWQG